VELFEHSMYYHHAEHHHAEHHRLHRSGWLRAAVLGANDGIVSTASLIMGVVAAGADRESILLAGLAGLVAGAMSMAAGEYVSVKSQEDTEKADLQLERWALEHHHEEEHRELASIYRERGLDPQLADEVARQLMVHDALAAHARDEIGITSQLSARPFQAALYSAAAFFTGAVVPVIGVVLAPREWLFWSIPLITLALLVSLGSIAAMIGGASPWRGALRVSFWGSLAMGLTGLVGKIFGIAV
jgi:VIT1/CCC1 family predicted Fe2+/Mn2+ transporter